MEDNVLTNDIWSFVRESFDTSLERLTAIVVKESDTTRYFTYPSDLGDIGYCFDFSEKSVYDNPPKFGINFGVYEYPNFRKGYSQNHILLKKCCYYPSMIRREFSYSNLGLVCCETLGNAIDGALSWNIEMNGITEGFRTEKKLFTILSSEEKFSANVDSNHIEIIFNDVKYYISFLQPVSVGLYSEENRMKVSIGTGELSKEVEEANYLVIGHSINIGPGEKHTISMGLSSISKDVSVKATEVKSMDEEIKVRWNKWFNSLPRVNFSSDMEKKAYYKSWWTIKTNYYNHPEWGPSVLESLPVYKGLWQWAIPSVEWHSDQNTEYTSQWVKKAMNMLIDSQREDGYITHAIYIDEERPGERWAAGEGVVQTPHLPWVALRYYNATGDAAPLRKWYEAFEMYYKYLCHTRDEKMKNLHLWGITSSFDTGLDTTSAFQRVTYGENGVKEDYCYPTIFAAERCRYEQAMAKLAEAIGLSSEYWLKESEATQTAMNKILWDADKDWYGVLHQDGTLDTRVGVDGLFVLVYNLVDKYRADGMKKNFLKLIGPFGIRTVAPDEPGYRDNVYWRGAAWPKTASLGIAACQQYYPDLMNTVHDAVINMSLSHPNIWECYVASTGELARSDRGFVCTPCMSSNVGAGDIIGSILIYHGFEMYGMEKILPLVDMENYHWNGVRVSVKNDSGIWMAKIIKEEKDSTVINFGHTGGISRKIEAAAGEEWTTVV